MRKDTKLVQDKVILGIDPGTNIMGYGVLHIKGKEMFSDSLGVIRLDGLKDHQLKLKRIFEKTVALIDEYKPDEMSFEAPFFGKNVQSMLKLGRAQGVAISAGLYRNIPIFEYAPKRVKQSITGNGNASKEQVAYMLQSILKFDKLPSYFDATDGMAVAVCHHFSSGKVSGGKSYSGWKGFISNNPGRVK